MSKPLTPNATHGEVRDDIAWAMCRQIRMDPGREGICEKCPSFVKTNYGNGTQMCRTLAETAYRTALSFAVSEIAPKTRGAYEPLTEAEIEDWRKNIKNKIFSDFDGEPNEAHGKTLQASFDRLCDMAINCRLYAEENQRLRDRPVSATRTILKDESPEWTNVSHAMPKVGEKVELILECGSELYGGAYLQADGDWLWRGFFIAPDVAEYWRLYVE